MKYTAEAFDEWWFTTQFDRAYWQVNSQKHQTEYKWAKLAWDAARRDLLAENERLSALAAQHLADQELLVGRERKRVAQECIDIIKGADTEKDAEAYLCGYVFAGNVIQRIRARYGAEE